MEDRGIYMGRMACGTSSYRDTIQQYFTGNNTKEVRRLLTCLLVDFLATSENHIPNLGDSRLLFRAETAVKDEGQVQIVKRRHPFAAVHVYKSRLIICVRLLGLLA